MAELVEVTAADDPRLGDYRDLRDVQLRRALEAEHGLFLAEGEKVVRRSVEAGFTPRSFLMAQRWLDGLADVLDRSDAPCYVGHEALAEEVPGIPIDPFPDVIIYNTAKIRGNVIHQLTYGPFHNANTWFCPGGRC